MSLPPLYRTPNLSRLLGPGETIIYTCKLHPFHGFSWLLGCLFLAGLAGYFFSLAELSFYWRIPAIISLVGSVVCLFIYSLPFRNTEIAVTTHRLLLRYGRFSIHSDEIDASHIDHYQLHQTPISSLFHYGTFILNLRAGKNIYYLKLVDVWHPLTFIQALTTLNPLFGHRDKV